MQLSEDLSSVGKTTDTGRLSLLELAIRTAVVVGVASAIVVILVGLAYAIDIVLLAFAAVLFAVFLRTLSESISHSTGWNEYLALAAALLALSLLVLLVGMFLIPPVLDQAAEVQGQLPKAFEELHKRIEQFSWGSWMIDRLQKPSELFPQPGAIVNRTSGAVAWLFGLIAVVIVVFFVGILLAIQPKYYIDGVLSLVPSHARTRAGEVMFQIGTTLRWWMMAKLIAMLIVGVATWLGLWMLNVPGAAALAVIAGIFTFVPNFGPIISAVPAVLLALLQGPSAALWVVVLYTSIQLVESYAITPRLQFKAVAMPPALLIIAQLIIWAWAGVLGLILATPLTAVALIMIRMLYIERPGRGPA